MAATNALNKRFFHTLKDGVVHWQGQVIGQIHEDVFLVQLFEWVLGDPNIQKLISLSEMKDWVFYSSLEDMNSSYENGYASKRLAKPEKPGHGH